MSVDPTAQPAAAQHTIARVCAALFVTGGGIGLASLAFQGSPDRNQRAVFLISVIAIAIAGLTTLRGARFPLWAFGVLATTGTALVTAGTYYVGWKAGEHQMAEFQQAKAFVELLHGDEKEFLTSMQGIAGSRGQNQIEVALTKFQTLEQNFEVLKKEAAGADRLLRILTTYGNALRQWKNGLMLLKEPNADTDRAQKMFKLGDRLRADACQEFDSRYAPGKPQSGN